MKQDDITLLMCCVMPSFLIWVERRDLGPLVTVWWLALALTVTSCSMLVSWTRRECLPNHASSYLLSLSCSRRDALQLLMLVMQSYRRLRTSSTLCSGALAYAGLSSAKRWCLMLCRSKTSDTSSVYEMNSIGPRTEQWDTLQLTRWVVELFSFTANTCVRSLK